MLCVEFDPVTPSGYVVLPYLLLVTLLQERHSIRTAYSCVWTRTLVISIYFTSSQFLCDSQESLVSLNPEQKYVFLVARQVVETCRIFSIIDTRFFTSLFITSCLVFSSSRLPYLISRVLSLSLSLSLSRFRKGLCFSSLFLPSRLHSLVS